jgi:hypothetical protein
LELGIPYDEVTNEQRHMGKAKNYADMFDPKTTKADRRAHG